MYRVFALIFCALAPALVGSQVRCTMPNGKVIEQKLAKTCPVGATKGETLDGTPIAIILAPQPKAPNVQAQAKSAPPSTPALSTPAAPSSYEDALAICRILLSTNNATSCDVDSNVFSTSVIDATIPAGAVAARMLCNEIKTAMRSAKRAIVAPSADWEIRFFSPYGSADRPIARCVL